METQFQSQNVVFKLMSVSAFEFMMITKIFEVRHFRNVALM